MSDTRLEKKNTTKQTLSIVCEIKHLLDTRPGNTFKTDRIKKKNP